MLESLSQCYLTVTSLADSYKYQESSKEFIKKQHLEHLEELGTWPHPSYIFK